MMPAIATKQIVSVRSDTGAPCPLCAGTRLDGHNDFDKACNHLMKDHGLKCLHVGQETHGDEDKPWYSTVAVFGR
jgi:hypothetical protein